MWNRMIVVRAGIIKKIEGLYIVIASRTMSYARKYGFREIL